MKFLIRLWMIHIAMCCSVFSFSVNASKTEHNNNSVIEGKFTPPSGKTLMFIGQDSDAIDDYLHAVPEDNIEGITLYTQLKHSDPKQTLFGIFRPANWQAGLVDYSLTLDKLPKAALAIGLAFDSCNQTHHGANIVLGRYDESLAEFAAYLKSQSPRRIFLRVGYEFDGLWNCYKPDTYKAAFRHIVKSLRMLDVTNVATVWQSAVWPSPQFAGEQSNLYDFNNNKHLNNWYPGDDVVDWVGLSTFYFDLSQYDLPHQYLPKHAQDKVLQFAKQKQKPVMIAEAAPQGYRIGKQTHSFIGANIQTPMNASAMWDNWYTQFFNYIEAHKDTIRAVAYINANWESQSMWFCAHGAKAGSETCKNGNWGDTRVQASPLIKEKWLNNVNNAKHWVQTADY